MSDVTVAQFAEVLKVPVDRLLVQLESAGIHGRRTTGVDQRRGQARAAHAPAPFARRFRAHQQDPARRCRAAQDHAGAQDAERAQAGEPQGRARTVNVEVRHKKTYIKRDVLEEQNKRTRTRLDTKRKEEEAAEAPSASARKPRASESERMEAENRRRIEDEATRKKQAEEARKQQEERGSPGKDAQRRAAAEAAAAHAQPARPERHAPQKAPVVAAVDPAKDATRYGRQELHVASGASARNKKKKRVKERTRVRRRERRGETRLRNAHRAR